MSAVAPKVFSMNATRCIARAYAAVLGLLTALNLVPELTDDQGRVLFFNRSPA